MTVSSVHQWCYELVKLAPKLQHWYCCSSAEISANGSSGFFLRLEAARHRDPAGHQGLWHLADDSVTPRAIKPPTILVMGLLSPL